MPQGIGEVASPAGIIGQGHEIVRSAGFDFAEVTCGLVAALSESDMASLIADGVRFYASNSFISLPIASTPSRELGEYVRMITERLERFGVRRCVFGSGRARRIPENAERAAGERVLRDFIDMCADAASRRNMLFVLEPLNRGETNFMNTLSDGADILRTLDNPSAALLCDVYHMYKNGEGVGEIGQYAKYLRHVHISEGDRAVPGTSGGGYLEAVADQLHAAGYTGGVSCECSYRDFPSDAPEICKFMKKTFVGRFL